MQFLYSKNAGENFLELSGDEFNHIFQSRRTKKEAKLNLRNLKDNNLYTYNIDSINKKSANLSLIESRLLIIKPSIFKHIIWAITESKTIEKTLPFLNELGVGKISFFYADFSQKNENLNIERITKILINSNQQNGRSDLMEIEILSDTKEALSLYKNASVLNFNGVNLDSSFSLENGVFIGPEGGFSKNEEALFKDRKIFKFEDNIILKSQTATIAISAKI